MKPADQKYTRHDVNEETWTKAIEAMNFFDQEGQKRFMPYGHGFCLRGAEGKLLFRDLNKIALALKMIFTYPEGDAWKHQANLASRYASYAWQQRGPIGNGVVVAPRKKQKRQNDASQRKRGREEEAANAGLGKRPAHYSRTNTYLSY